MTSKELEKAVIDALAESRGTTWLKRLDNDGEVCGEEEVDEFNDDRALELILLIAQKHADEQMRAFHQWQRYSSAFYPTAEEEIAAFKEHQNHQS